MAPADILRAARARIEDPKNWQQGWYASTADGRRTMGSDPDAACFCAYGALDNAGASESGEISALLEAAAVRLFNQDLIDVNDQEGHAAVLQVFDAAIAAAEAEAGR